MINHFLKSLADEDLFIDIVNICLYNSDLNLYQGDFSKKIFQFMDDLLVICRRMGTKNINVIQSKVLIIKSMLNIKDSGISNITYDNIYKYISTMDIFQENIINSALSNKILNTDEFRKKLDDVAARIQIFYEIKGISKSLVLFDEFTEYANRPGSNIYEITKLYRDNVVRLYNDLTKLPTISKLDSESDYFLINDENSKKRLARNVVNFISKDYSYLKTGYNILDNNIDGLESSTVHIVTAPSNHGKSLLMINIAKRVVQENTEEWENGDGILFITLEDDIYKLTRRFCSIFGNYDPKLIRKMYKRGHEVSKMRLYNGQDLNMVQDIFFNMFNNSMKDININLVIKHANENFFSSGDVGKFVDRLRAEGIKIKLILLDYIDVMTPTFGSKGTDYDDHGIITQELRILSRMRKVPIITATHLKRGADNINYGISNEMIGDSIKKFRSTDFLYIFRQDPSKTALGLDKAVIPKKYYDGDVLNREILEIGDDINRDLIPLEFKIVKAKDSDRDITKYLLFCKRNLKIYNNVEEYIIDMKNIPRNMNFLKKLLDELSAVENADIGEFDLYMNNHLMEF